jgi:glyoxylase-like metal-dependent hydrolase (beta-lactamase superfamily II)
MGIVKQIRVGPMQNFAYLLVDEGSREAMAIDSGWETDPIVEAAEREKMVVKYAVATHEHFDHVTTLRELADRLGAKVVAHEASGIDADLRVRGGDALELGQVRVEVIHTPGHTEDSICLFDGRNVFTGDTLFIGNCGRTDLPGGSVRKMYHSLHDTILALPPETLIYPGHDYGNAPYRSLGEERKTNPTLLANSLEEFTGVE